MITLKVNGESHSIDVDPDTPLLWALRDNAGLTGTKYACGIGVCGACVVHRNGEPVRSCILPVSEVGDAEITTIEGLSTDRSHPVQRAWIEADVPQCGYCQSGQIMATAALLAKTPNPSQSDIDNALGGQLCRCGTYNYVRDAVSRAVELAAKEGVRHG